MKPKKSKNRKKKRETFLQDTIAVSEVVGFVLILGILLAVTSVYIAQRIPELTKEFEAEHAAKVPHDFAKLSSNIDMAVLSEDTSPSSATPIGMRSGSVLLVGIYSSGGTLRFNPSQERFECIASAPGETAPPGGIPPPWHSTPTNFTTYERFQVVTPARGAELKLEIGEDKTTTDKEYLAGAFRFNHFVVPKNAKLYTSELIIYARNITIESDAEINADGRSAAGGVYDVSGKGPGAGLNYANNDSAGGGGAGNGGAGGAGGSSHYGDGGAGGSAYGEPTDEKTALPGSGGGGGSSSPLVISQWLGGDGGDGGGSILLHAPVITIAGTVSVNGNNGGGASNGDDSAGGGGGGGSGGCILLRGDNVTVSGILSANGGNGGDGGRAPDHNGGGGGGGAGGIIKIFYDSHFENTGMVGYVNGGNGGDEGDEGTGGTGGDDGADGIFYPDGSWLPYSPEVRYYATGHLISNLTSTQGHVGYDTTTSLVCYRNMTWKETVDEDTKIIMKVRTSMKPDMSDALPWEECPAVSNGQDISRLSSVSDGHRYIQWRAELETYDLAKTPVLHSMNINYEYCLPFLVNSSGSIRYSSQYLHLPNYKLVYEHGAIIKNQTEGEFMLQSPPISITKQGDVTKLIISSTNLTGIERTFSGGFQTTIKPSYRDSALITGGLNFHNLTLDITTGHPAAWENWFNETCKDAGLTRGISSGNYDTNRTGNTLQIIFHGNETRPINVWLKSSEARIEIEKELL